MEAVEKIIDFFRLQGHDAIVVTALRLKVCGGEGDAERQAVFGEAALKFFVLEALLQKLPKHTMLTEASKPYLLDVNLNKIARTLGLAELLRLLWKSQEAWTDACLTTTMLSLLAASCQAASDQGFVNFRLVVKDLMKRIDELAPPPTTLASTAMTAMATIASLLDVPQETNKSNNFQASFGQSSAAFREPGSTAVKTDKQQTSSSINKIFASSMSFDVDDDDNNDEEDLPFTFAHANMPSPSVRSFGSPPSSSSSSTAYTRPTSSSPVSQPIQQQQQQQQQQSPQSLLASLLDRPSKNMIIDTLQARRLPPAEFTVGPSRAGPLPFEAQVSARLPDENNSMVMRTTSAQGASKKMAQDQACQNFLLQNMAFFFPSVAQPAAKFNVPSPGGPSTPTPIISHASPQSVSQLALDRPNKNLIIDALLIAKLPPAEFVIGPNTSGGSMPFEAKVTATIPDEKGREKTFTVIGVGPTKKAAQDLACQSMIEQHAHFFLSKKSITQDVDEIPGIYMAIVTEFYQRFQLEKPEIEFEKQEGGLYHNFFTATITMRIADSVVQSTGVPYPTKAEARDAAAKKFLSEIAEFAPTASKWIRDRIAKARQA